MTVEPLPLWDPDAPVLPRLKVADLTQFLRDAGLGEAFEVYPGPNVPDPKKDSGPIIVITLLPGFGPTTAGVMENTGFQVRTVGPQLDEDKAAEIARRIDHALVGPRTEPLAFGGLYVAGIWRAGAPQPLPVTDDDRSHWVCTYSIEIESYG